MVSLLFWSDRVSWASISPCWQEGSGLCSSLHCEKYWCGRHCSGPHAWQWLGVADANGRTMGASMRPCEALCTGSMCWSHTVCDDSTTLEVPVLFSFILPQAFSARYPGYCIIQCLVEPILGLQCKTVLEHRCWVGIQGHKILTSGVLSMYM